MIEFLLVMAMIWCAGVAFMVLWFAVPVVLLAVWLGLSRLLVIGAAKKTRPADNGPQKR